MPFILFFVRLEIYYGFIDMRRKKLLNEILWGNFLILFPFDNGNENFNWFNCLELFYFHTFIALAELNDFDEIFSLPQATSINFFGHMTFSRIEQQQVWLWEIILPFKRTFLSVITNFMLNFRLLCFDFEQFITSLLQIFIFFTPEFSADYFCCLIWVSFMRKFFFTFKRRINVSNVGSWRWKCVGNTSKVENFSFIKFERESERASKAGCGL